MDSARPKNAKNLLSLKQAADKLSVSPEVLLNLNEYNILKPTITLTGEIGYSQDQIDNFLVIQQLSSQSNKALPQTIASPPHQTQQGLSEISNAHGTNNLIQKPLKDSTDRIQIDSTPNVASKKNLKISSFLAISSFSFIITLIFLIATQYPNLKTSNTNNLTASSNEINVKHDSSVSELGSTVSPSVVAPIQNKYKITTENTAKGLGVTEDNLAMRNQIFDNKSTKTAEDYIPDQVPNIPLPEKETNYKANTNKFRSFTSQNNCPSCVKGDQTTNKSVFDKEGNITGEPIDTNLLAFTGLTAGLNREATGLHGPNPILMLSFLGLGSLALLFIFKNQLAYSANKTSSEKTEPLKASVQVENPRILEINQKTDGTVAISFQGKDHKVSKPEFDSESDQFITRLMELVQFSTKEIDYDTLSDEKIRFNTPLSKLVTRLGFVGVKRDLFFPRTSKNKVLFRRYITQDDLNAMSLTPEEIINHL